MSIPRSYPVTVDAEDVARAMCDADLWVGAWEEQKIALIDIGADWREDPRIKRYLSAAPAVMALYAARTAALSQPLGVAQGAGNSGEPAQPATGPMRFDLILQKVDAENAENGEAFNDMRAHIWAAGASHEDADFITRMLARKGLYLFQTEPWKRCPSTHCERRGECAGPRDCTIKFPGPSVSSTDRGAG